MWNTSGPFWSVNKGDPVLPLRQFLEDYLSSGREKLQRDEKLL